LGERGTLWSMDTEAIPRACDPSDVDDEEGSLVAPSLTLMDDAAPQRRHPSRDLFNGLRRIVRAGAPWRMLQPNLPPWHAAHEQTKHWIAAACFERLPNRL
jgi:transposase